MKLQNGFEIRKKVRGEDVASSEKKLLETVVNNFVMASEYEKEQREHELDCLKMCDPSTQWDDSIKSSRGADGRPVMTEDRINPMVSVVVNSLSQSRAAVTINPVSDTDQETADVVQGLIRHITTTTTALNAYDVAATSMVRTGRGFYRVLVDYEDSESFDQIIKVAPISNHHMLYIDPAAVESDLSDMNWAIISEDMDIDTFKDTYPDADSSSMDASTWSSLGDDIPEFYNKDTVRVIEYFYKVPRKVKLVRLNNGQVLTSDKLPKGVSLKEGAIIYPSLMEEEQLYIDAIRDSVILDVKWAKMTAIEVLEQREWPGKYIPIVPVLGKDLLISNKKRWYGLITGMIDPQKRFNWLLSAQLEAINLVPKAPWLAQEGSLINPNAWNNAHKSPQAVLYYKREIDGTPINMPSRVSASVDVSAISQALMYAADGLKGTSGLYNPSMGASEGGQSGVAIRAQQAQGDMSTAHFQQGITRARKLEGLIYLDLMGKVYDTQRVLRIVKEDESSEQVVVNEETGEGTRKFDLSIGKYDLTVSAGPSYSTKRQENLAVLMSLAQTMPIIGQVAPDLISSQVDTPISKTLTKRLKATLPPQLLEGEEQGKKNGQPPIQELLRSHDEATQILKEMSQEIQRLEAALTDKQKDRDKDITVAKINAGASIKRALVSKAPATAPLLLQEYKVEDDGMGDVDEYTQNSMRGQQERQDMPEQEYSNVPQQNFNQYELDNSSDNS